jgi:hypothetical protein
LSNRPGILPLKRSDREQEVRPQVGPVDRVRELLVEGAGPVLLAVVEEVLLELVEQQEQFPVHLAAPVVEHFRERRARRRAGQLIAAEQRRHLRARGGRYRLQGIGVGPGAHDDQGEAGCGPVCEVVPGALTERAGDTREED